MGLSSTQELITKSQPLQTKNGHQLFWQAVKVLRLNPLKARRPRILKPKTRENRNRITARAYNVFVSSIILDSKNVYQ